MLCVHMHVLLACGCNSFFYFVQLFTRAQSRLYEMCLCFVCLLFICKPDVQKEATKLKSLIMFADYTALLLCITLFLSCTCLPTYYTL